MPELIADSGGEPSEIIARIDFVGLDKKKAKAQLQALGLRRSAIYPDIDNFVRQLKEQYSW